MASEQLSRRDNTTKEREIEVEKERVPQLTSHFEAIAVQGKAPIPEKTEEKQRKEAHGTSIAKGELPGREEERRRIESGGGKPDETRELATQFESLAEKVRDKRETDTENERQRQARENEQRESRIREEQGVQKQRDSEQAKGKKGEIETRQNQPSLEEISNFRAIAQEKSNEAIRAAKERYDKANKESLNQGVGGRTEESEQRETEEGEEDTVEGGGERTGLETVKETLTSAAKTAKDYTVPIAEKAKDYTVQKAVEAKDMTVSAGQTTAHYLGEKAVAAKDVALESGKVAAEYAGKAAEDLKDKAVVAGWSTAHYSCDTAVEGTKAAARLVKGAAEYAGAIAAKPLSAAKNVAETTGESMKDYTARKKEEAEREAMYKTGEKESMYERTKETFERGKEVKERGEGRGNENRVDDGGILGAIGETIYEIAQTTKEMVIGGGDESGKQSTLGFEIGQEEGEGKEAQYQTATRKEYRG
ncbi:seed biotin-containing protein SBP65 [Benincasa hispida]|uniref:seed biotin-containing protein SBP65 n=1 Tax=Benincasa hispida TaxID=102211 RepID=UPI0018FFFF1B|nr:seed biotin-containing protein SBP65 [Benincasa hispida]